MKSQQRCCFEVMNSTAMLFRSVESTALLLSEGIPNSVAVLSGLLRISALRALIPGGDAIKIENKTLRVFIFLFTSPSLKRSLAWCVNKKTQHSWVFNFDAES